jgi:hypothetical protein
MPILRRKLCSEYTLPGDEATRRWDLDLPETTGAFRMSTVHPRWNDRKVPALGNHAAKARLF